MKMKIIRDAFVQNWSPLFYVLSAFFLSRLFIILVGYFADITIIDKKEDILHLFCKWDCGWYLHIIKDGYEISPLRHPNENEANWAFFPAFPLTARFASSIFLLSPLAASYIVSNIFFLLTLILFSKYTSLTLTKEQTIFAIYLFAFFPYSFYFFLPYTEALFVLLLTAVFYFATTNRWLIAGVVASFLSATRNLGVFIIFPMLIIAIQKFGFRKLLHLEGASIKAAFAILIAPLGLFLYMFFLYLHMGDPLAFAHVQVAWGRTISNPLKHLASGFLSFRFPDTYLASFAIAGILCGLYMLKIKRYSEGIMTLILILIPASTGVVSLPRYCVIIFPIYIYLSIIVRTNQLRYIIIGLSILFNSFLVIAWVTAKNFMT